MLYFQLLAVVAVFAAIAWLATGRGGEVGETYPDRPDVALPDDRQLRKEDVDAARFTVGWRGYRMDEVDAVLDRLAAEVEYRDRLIAELVASGGTAGGRASNLDYDYRPASLAVADVGPSTQLSPFGAAEAPTGTVDVPPTQQHPYGALTPVPPVVPPTFAPTPPYAPTAQPGVQPGSGNPGDPPDGEHPDDENPLTAWYRRPE